MSFFQQEEEQQHQQWMHYGYWNMHKFNRWNNYNYSKIPETLQLPSVSDYVALCHDAYAHTTLALRSVFQLATVTLRPLMILVALFLKMVWYLLSNYVCHGLIVSLHHGVGQLWWAGRCLYKWQTTRSRHACVMEAVFVMVLLLCVVLQRHIRRRRYISKSRQWLRRQQRRVRQSYNRTVHRVAQTSLFLAMCLPHVVFVGAVAVVKLTVPRLLTYLAVDTYLMALLSMVYPLLVSIALLHSYNTPMMVPLPLPVAEHHDTHEKHQGTTQQGTQTPKRHTQTTAPHHHHNATPTTTPQQLTPTTRFFPRTTPGRHSIQRWMRKAATAGTPLHGHNRTNTSSNNKNDSMPLLHVQAQHWLQYWVVLSLLQAMVQLCQSIPIVGRLLVSATTGTVWWREFQLILVVWIFVVPLMTTTTTTTSISSQQPTRQQPSQYNARPLVLLQTQLAPVVIRLVEAISSAVPTHLYQWGLDKVRSILDVCVLLRLFSQDTRDHWVEQVLPHGRALLVPSVTCWMPSVVTSYGILYVRAVLPSYRSLLALQAESSDMDGSSSSTTGSSIAAAAVQERMQCLEYWVLHWLMCGVLHWWAPVLWWIPFSTHVTFVVWCYLQYPSSVTRWYGALEEELQAFGLLDRGDKMDLTVEQTVTVSVLRRLAKSLPSGVDEKGEESVQEQTKNHEIEQNDEETLLADEEEDAVMVDAPEQKDGDVDMHMAINDDEQSSEGSFARENVSDSSYSDEKEDTGSVEKHETNTP